jgi:hypothetical protein
VAGHSLALREDGSLINPSQPLCPCLQNMLNKFNHVAEKELVDRLPITVPDNHRGAFERYLPIESASSYIRNALSKASSTKRCPGRRGRNHQNRIRDPFQRSTVHRHRSSEPGMARDTGQWHQAGQATVWGRGAPRSHRGLFHPREPKGRNPKDHGRE